MTYFEIGILNSKTPSNIGTLWRSAYQLGASGLFTINHRWGGARHLETSDTYKAYCHIPLRHYDDFEAFHDSIPYDCKLVGVEMGGCDLKTFKHPKRAIYLLGAEDTGLPNEIVDKCDMNISLSSVRSNSYNVAVVGSLVGYHRMFL